MTKRDFLDRQHFVEVLCEVGVPEHDAALVLRHAATLQRLAAERCNRELTRVEEKRDESSERRIRELCEPYRVRVLTSGDPRGSVVTLMLPNGYTDNFAGDGVYVPTPRY